MSGINVVTKIDEFVKIQNVLISVSDKNNLSHLVVLLLTNNPNLRIFSTGGTYAEIKEILEGNGWHPNEVLTQVSDYTGQPETQGGLVKTLDFKIYLGILTETYNEAHQSDLARTEAVPIDMVVCNLYPFQKTISRPDVTPEEARGNIDIGGPCMIRAAAKNFLRVASVVEPADYRTIIAEMNKNNGCLSLATRFRLARKAFRHTGSYDQVIADYLEEESIQSVVHCYPEIL